MKLLYIVFLCVVIANGITAQGITKYGQNTDTSANFVNQNGQTGSSAGLNKNGKILALAVLTTTAATSITNSSASSGGDITSNGGANVLAYGVCWSTSVNPTIANRKTKNGAGTGIFVSSITLLSGDSTYYVRAYATNSVGTAYGNQVSFTTPAPTLASITTTTPSSIASTTATSGGDITNDGGASVTAYGVCWGTTRNPTTANSKTNDGSGVGTFASSLTGLTSGTTYYVRAYAINSVGTAYGNDDSLTTLALPVVTTTTPSSITITSASSGGDVTSNGGATVTAHGVCWNTSRNPTIANSLTNNGSGTGTYLSSLTGLNSNTTYYVRAYATNIVGTAYGNDDSLTTYTGTVTDCDGNIYYTITIGTQVWMDENLMTTHYRTGCAAIPYVSGSAWNSESTGAYTYYATYDTTTLGLLYNWYTITNSDSLCPVGFHVPDSTEWGTLIKHVGGYGSAGGALKVTGTTYWASPNTGATNSSGFSAYGGGYYNGSATDATDDGNYWTSTSTGTKGYYIYMYYGASYVQKNTSSKTLGYSVRCIKN